MLKNLFSNEKDVDMLVAELRKESSDAETVITLYRRIRMKAAARGVVIGSVIGFAVLGGLYVYKQAINPNE
jgi:hypothetical protein